MDEKAEAPMTARDHFAAAALTGLLAVHEDAGGDRDAQLERLARGAYEIADAMLAERARDGRV